MVSAGVPPASVMFFYCTPRRGGADGRAGRGVYLPGGVRYTWGASLALEEEGAGLPTNRLWLLLLLLVGAATLMYWAGQTEPAQRETLHDTAEDLTLLSFAPAEVREIVVFFAETEVDTVAPAEMRAPAGPRIVLRRVADDGTELPTPGAEIPDETGLWRYEEPASVPADDETIEKIVGALAELQAFRPVTATTDEPLDPADFGLAPPRATIHVVAVPAADGPPTTHRLDIGYTTPVPIGDHPSYYVQGPALDGIFTAGGPALSVLTLHPQEGDDSLDDDLGAQGDVHH